MTTPLYVRITEAVEDEANASTIVRKNETLSFGALGWSGGLQHVDLYRGSGKRVRFDLEYFKRVAVAVDHVNFQPQPRGLQDPALRRVFVQAGKSDAERLGEERDAFKARLMESFVYLTMLADKVELLHGGKPEGTWGDGKRLAEEIRQFVREGHKLP